VKKVLAQEYKNTRRIERSFLEYLPSLYRDDKNMEQFLHIFEDILNPIENTIDNLDLYFDPSLTTEPVLSWLASWLGLVLDENIPLKNRRELVGSAAELYRWRGTKRGLSEFLRIYTGNTPEISESVSGMCLDRDNRLGINTKLGSSGTGFQFSVSLKLDDNSPISLDTLKSIIDSEKPAHAVYTLQITQNNIQLTK
jgi:phage tail-like protein